MQNIKYWYRSQTLIILTSIHRWVHPEFKDDEDLSSEAQAGTGTEEEVAVEIGDNREMVDNGNNLRGEEDIVVDMEMEPLKAKQ